MHYQVYNNMEKVNGSGKLVWELKFRSQSHKCIEMPTNVSLYPPKLYADVLKMLRQSLQLKSWQQHI